MTRQVGPAREPPEHRPGGARGIGTVGVAIVAGSVAGLAVSLLVGKWNADRLAAKQAAMERQLEESRARSAPVFILPQRGASESSRDEPGSPISPPFDRAADGQGGSLQPDDIRAARESRRAQLRVEEAAKIQKHWSDPVDAPWAKVSTPSLKMDLEELAKTNGFRVTNVDCRSTSCVAVLEWANAEAASAELATVGQGRFAVNCSRSIRMPDVSDPSEPVQATLHLDCARWKEKGSRLDEIENERSSPPPYAPGRPAGQAEATAEAPPR